MIRINLSNFKKPKHAIVKALGKIADVAGEIAHTELHWPKLRRTKKTTADVHRKIRDVLESQEGDGAPVQAASHLDDDLGDGAPVALRGVKGSQDPADFDIDIEGHTDRSSRSASTSSKKKAPAVWKPSRHRAEIQGERSKSHGKEKHEKKGDKHERVSTVRSSFRRKLLQVALAVIAGVSSTMALLKHEEVKSDVSRWWGAVFGEAEPGAGEAKPESSEAPAKPAPEKYDSKPESKPESGPSEKVTFSVRLGEWGQVKPIKLSENELVEFGAKGRDSRGNYLFEVVYTRNGKKYTLKNQVAIGGGVKNFTFDLETDFTAQ